MLEFQPISSVIVATSNQQSRQFDPLYLYE